MSDTRTDPLAHIKKGDAPMPVDVEAWGDCPATQDPFLCTRDAGHPGQHIADGTSQVWAVWTDQA